MPPPPPQLLYTDIITGDEMITDAFDVRPPSLGAVGPIEWSGPGAESWDRARRRRTGQPKRTAGDTTFFWAENATLTSRLARFSFAAQGDRRRRLRGRLRHDHHPRG